MRPGFTISTPLLVRFDLPLIARFWGVLDGAPPEEDVQDFLLDAHRGWKQKSLGGNVRNVGKVRKVGKVGKVGDARKISYGSSPSL